MSDRVYATDPEDYKARKSARFLSDLPHDDAHEIRFAAAIQAHVLLYGTVSAEEAAAIYERTRGERGGAVTW